jgi:SMP-30/Gluconolactonase/LRE-like region
MSRFPVPPRAPAIATALFALLVTGGCLGPRFYRPESVLHRDGYDLAFIELDDQGELWSNAQVLAADRLIRDASTSEGVILGVFIHGWQHNASPGDGNVAGFESMLGQIAEFERVGEGAPRRVVGVFVGWRGRSSRVKLLAPLTFFARFEAAQRVASTATTEMIFRLLLAGRAHPRSTTVVVGHSFGGLILESALAQAIIGGLGAAVQQDVHDVAFPADLVLLINPASQSIEAKELVDIFDRHHLKLYREGRDGETYEVPLVVSMTSTADLATRVLFPLGMRLRGIGNRFRPYGPESCARGRQKDYFRQTAGHQRPLHSHLVEAEALPSSERKGGDAALVRAFRGSLTHTYDAATRLQTWSAEGERLRYHIRQNPRSWNDTPYWVMEVPPSIIPDHYQIFGQETIEFAGMLIAMSGALEGGDGRARLVRDDRIKPVIVSARSNGTIRFLDRSQQIFGIDPESSEPRFVSCVPESLTAVEDVIGVAGTPEVAWLAGTLRGFGKRAEDTRIGVTRISVADRGLEAHDRALPRGVDATAAAFDLDRGRMFLARKDRPEIDIIDLTNRSSLVPVLLLDLGASGPMQILIYDSTRDRLFASDGRSTVVAVDLATEPPRLETVATDFALPTALAFDRERRRLYVSTESDGTVWRLDCEVSCGPPRRLAASQEVGHPRSLAVDAKGVVWVGDLENRAIGALSPEGELLRVIQRLPGS